ncbi:MAG: IS5/IS1182 family transposase, partial [Rhodopseudomonas sp.]
MRGGEEGTGSLFSFVAVEARVRADHPLRTIRRLANAALAD